MSLEVAPNVQTPSTPTLEEMRRRMHELEALVFQELRPHYVTRKVLVYYSPRSDDAATELTKLYVSLAQAIYERLKDVRDQLNQRHSLNLSQAIIQNLESEGYKLWEELNVLPEPDI